MSKVEIYTHPTCSYCHQAKGLLNRRGIKFEELDVGQNRQLLLQMLERTGGRTVPQIVIGNQAIGGFDALRELDQSDSLQKLICN